MFRMGQSFLESVAPVVSTIATIPAFIASGRSGHAAAILARSGSIEGESAESAPESAPLVSELAEFPKDLAGCSSPTRGVKKTGTLSRMPVFLFVDLD